MTNHVFNNHDHSGFDPPSGYGDPAGRPVNHDLLGRFVGAAYDGCASCQDTLLTQLVQDGPTLARLVELACITVAAPAGGLPPSLTDERVPGLASPAFRRLAGAGADGNNDRMFDLAGQMPHDERRAAASTATDILIGSLVVGPADA